MRKTVCWPGLRTGIRLSGLLVAGLLGACSSVSPHRPVASTSTGEPQQNIETRLLAIEAGMQQLAQRIDALQSTRDGQRSAALNRSDLPPAEFRPVRPSVVLASGQVRKVPVIPAAPVREPAPAPVVEPARAPRKAPVSPPQRKGDWVINLASYKNRTYAARKRAEFAGKGVEVEQVSAQVKGKTIYRLRVPGFSSSLSASTEAASIRNKLGLKSTWIARH